MEKKKVFVPVDIKAGLPDNKGIYHVIYNRENAIAMFTQFKEWYLEKHVFSNDFYYIKPEYWLKQEELYCFTKEELIEMRAKDYINGQNNGSEAMQNANEYVHFEQYIQSLNLK